MKNLRAAVFHLETSNAWLSDAHDSYIRGHWGILSAAADLARCGAHSIKALLHYTGVVPADTCDVKTLISVAKNSNIDIPKYLIECADILQEFNNDMLCDVDELEYARAQNVCSRFVTELIYLIRCEAIIKLRELVPVSRSILSDDDLLFEYWRKL